MGREAGRGGWAARMLDGAARLDWRAVGTGAAVAAFAAVVVVPAGMLAVTLEGVRSNLAASARGVGSAWPAVARDLRDPGAWEATRSTSFNLLRLGHGRASDLSGALPRVAASWMGPVEVLAGKPGRKLSEAGGEIEIHACPPEGSPDPACRRWRGGVAPS